MKNTMQVLNDDPQGYFNSLALVAFHSVTTLDAEPSPQQKKAYADIYRLLQSMDSSLRPDETLN